MIDHDNSKREGFRLFTDRGVGMAITRTCGRCGKPRENRGGEWHRVLGWIGGCCAKPGKAKEGGK